MKTPNKRVVWCNVCGPVLASFLAFQAVADDASASADSSPVPEKTCTGMVLSVNNNEHVLSLKGWLGQRKTFNLGNSCSVFHQGNENLPMNNLQAGQKVTVSYQDRHGVLIADHVQDVPMRLEGMVESIDPTNHTFTIHEGIKHTKVGLVGGCAVKLRGGTFGTVADIKTGNYVTVTYIVPGDLKIAKQVAQTSIEFTGELTAIDLENRTLKARTVLGSKEFHLSDHCAVVINGQPNGKLTDLRPQERLVFNYDAIDGVNVVNRIAPADQVQSHATDSASD